MNTNTTNTPAIYRIVSDTLGQCYIGSTYKSLDDRLYQHRQLYRRYINENTPDAPYYTSFDILEQPDARIELIETPECANRDELYVCEGKHILANRANCVNRNIPGRGPNHRREYMANYRRANHEALTLRRREFIDCECGLPVRRGSMTLHRRSARHLNRLP